MKIDQVAAQLFTCRELLKNPTDIASTLKKIRQIGYTAVQVSGMGAIAEEELLRILDGEGLVCCATHEPGEKILSSPESIIERLQKLKCKITAYPFPRGIDLGIESDVVKWFQQLNHAGEVLANAGFTLCYHNHNMEFRKLGKKIIWDRIFRETNTKFLQAEPDTYWVHYGGGDVVSVCNKLKGRLPIIHLKDYRTNDKNLPELCEIGAGNLDFKCIIPAAEASGCQWFVVEQDTCPGNPVDSLAQSFQYITENLLGEIK